MSDDSGQEKTEEPTGRKLAKAREDGNVPRSQEVSSWFMILMLALMIGLMGQWIFQDLGALLVRFLAQPESFSIGGDGFYGEARSVVGEIFSIMLLPFLLIICAAVLASVIQNGWVFSAEQLKPEISKIGFKKGMQKIFSTHSLTEFTKGIIKITLVAVIVVLVVWPDRDSLSDLITMPIPDILVSVQITALKVVGTVLALLTVIAVVDVIYQRYDHSKKLRMTHQEIKDENKQTEGDPKIKRRLAQIRYDRARQRMMAAVPEADVVITNPTHYAIALRYDQSAMEAPRLLAKGVDEVAARIREVAKEHKIPLVENPPLARALYASVELDQEIPPEHYQAVAQVISYVMRIHGKLRSSVKMDLRRRRKKRLGASGREPS